MKQLLQMLVVLLCSFSLAACDTMTNQDTGAMTGALAGGLLGSTVGEGSGQFLAIAAGTIAGAYIGGAVGKSMDDMDRLKVKQALENNDVGEPAYWRNERTKSCYRVVPMKNVAVDGNQYCREYRTIAEIAGKKQEMYGTACRQPDGSWKAVA